MSLSAPKANPVFHAANKNLFTKTHFDTHHLTSSFYLYLPLNLSEGTNNKKSSTINLSENIFKKLINLSENILKTLIESYILLTDTNKK